METRLEGTRKYCSVAAFFKNEESYTCRTIVLSMEMPPEQALGQLTVFPGNCNHVRALSLPTRCMLSPSFNNSAKGSQENSVS